VTAIGTWEVSVESPMGTQVLSIEFLDEHTGIARYGTDSLALENVSVSGDSASCSFSITQPLRVTLKCSVTVDGDLLTGTASAGFLGKFPLNGRRVSS
jgi:hypothetical protein